MHNITKINIEITIDDWEILRDFPINESNDIQREWMGNMINEFNDVIDYEIIEDTI